MTKKSNHRGPHKYVLCNSHTTFWKCAIAGCPHIMYQYLRDAMVGRNSLCNECNIIFTLSESDIKDELPKCFNCKNNITVDDMDEILRIAGLSNEE